MAYAPVVWDTARDEYGPRCPKHTDIVMEVRFGVQGERLARCYGCRTKYTVVERGTDMVQELAPLGSGQLYDFDLNDFGLQPDYDKTFLDGKVLVIHGVSESTFEGDFAQSARSLLHNLPQDWANGVAPCGALMSDESPAIRQASEMQGRGKAPFVARLRQVPSQRHKGQTYWTLEKAPSFQYDENGNLIDPNDYATEVSSEGKGKGK